MYTKQEAYCNNCGRKFETNFKDHFEGLFCSITCKLEKQDKLALVERGLYLEKADITQ